MDACHWRVNVFHSGAVRGGSIKRGGGGIWGGDDGGGRRGRLGAGEVDKVGGGWRGGGLGYMEYRNAGVSSRRGGRVERVKGVGWVREG